MEYIKIVRKNVTSPKVKEYIVLVTGLISIILIAIFSIIYIKSENYLFMGMFLPFLIMIYSLKLINEKNVSIYFPILCILTSTGLVFLLARAINF